MCPAFVPRLCFQRWADARLRFPFRPADGSIRLWIARTDILVDLACQRVRRNLTRAEWTRYLPGEDYRQTCFQ
jgi:hypothetical protein